MNSSPPDVCSHDPVATRDTLIMNSNPPDVCAHEPQATRDALVMKGDPFGYLCTCPALKQDLPATVFPDISGSRNPPGGCIVEFRLPRASGDNGHKPPLYR